MRDLTDRALDTASAQGAGYADVRVVRRLEESISIKTGRVEGVASGESEGFGVRVLVDGAWGFAASHVLTAAGGGSRRRRGRPDRPGERDRPARTGPALDDRPPAHGTYETPLEEDPFAVPLETKIADLLAADQAAAARQGHRLHRVDLRRPARMEDLRRDRRQPDRAGHHPRRRGHRGATPSTATSTSAGATPTRAAAGGAGGLRVRPRPAARRAGRAARRGGRRAAHRAAVPVGPVHDHPRPVASSTSRSTNRAAIRPSSTASSGPRRPTPGRAS